MGRIMKFGIERLGHRNLEVKLDCPNCGSARIGFSSARGNGHTNDITCPKCGTQIVLDGVNITAIFETVESDVDITESPEAQNAGTIV